jgi:hypothetical protein
VEPSDEPLLNRAVADLVVEVGRLSRHVDDMRARRVPPADLPTLDPDDDGEVVSRATVPPVTADRVSDRAFDILLGDAPGGTGTDA